ncbi:uncharacterized protein LY89DRAFT_770466 [Mollisia scopiformis]|uniref:Uncharacterized protein n=1 Tax=Mollisia scopiformis TaxID=149040 RepID=A0A194XM61_MOLSC|nr:uncharacterized protein LY89DRAFT_770466 [Mollisia scopiformis]KUJ21226.1 hypothetical protein LY89DRAFT_770466 [Mollisia scopiformis]
MSSVPLHRIDQLQGSLRKTPNTPTFSLAVTRTIWTTGPPMPGFQLRDKEYRSYFVHIYKELTAAACSGDSQIPDLTHKQILEIVQQLKVHPCTKSEAQDFFRSASNNNDAQRIERAVILAAGLLVPLNFKAGGGARRGATVSWENNDTLSQMAEKEFAARLQTSSAARTKCPSCNRVTKFPRSFNARQLTRIAGFEIIWTNNLLDHLLLEDDDGTLKVYIFHQAKILEHHLSLANTIIPSKLSKETLHTLAMLIPRSDRRVRKWYKGLQKTHVLDPGVLSLEYLKPELRDIDHFKFWGD